MPVRQYRGFTRFSGIGLIGDDCINGYRSHGAAFEDHHIP